MTATDSGPSACPSLEGTRFGQTEPPLWEFIKGILDRYPEGGQILKELVQNADDAGATEVNFMLDGRPRAYRPSTPLHRSLAKFQGPALYAQNNAVFQDEDWKGIQSPYRSVKKDDPLKIGKFGIGFNSVYHMTDLPTIVSGNKVAFLDPHKRLWPGESGRSFSLDLAQEPELRSQFEPLNVLGCNVFESTDYRGTLFRFPLRQDSSDSKISSSVWDADRVLKVVFESFKVDAHLILLFLKSVEKVSLYQWLPGRKQPQLVFTTSVSPSTLRQVRTSRRELLEGARNLAVGSGIESDEKRFCIGITCSLPSKVPITQDWMVFHRIDNSNADVRKMAADLHLTPCIGLALPLGQRTEHASQLGRIFCFLPLPPSEDDCSETGLPVHIHGSFSVADDRRSLKWPARDREHDSKALWNYRLLKYILPPAYSNLIYTSTGQLDTWIGSLGSVAVNDVYSAWPNPQHVRDHWRKITLPTLLTTLATREVLYTEALGGKWVRSNEAVVCSHSANDSELAARQQMISLGHPVVVVPTNVDQCLSKTLGLDVKRMDPAYVRNALRGLGSVRDRHGTANSTRSDQLKLLRYILLDGVYSDLRGLRLLPVADGSLETFSSGGMYASPVYISSEECPLSLFPGLEKTFMDMTIDAGLREKLASPKMNRATQIQKLSTAQVPELVREILPQRKSLAIGWLPGRDLPTDTWMSGFWDWLLCHPNMLSAFVGCHMIPCVSKGNKYLVQLSQDKPIIFGQLRGTDIELEEEVTEGLRHLGCVVVNNTPRYIKAHPNIARYVLPPSRVLTCLARLRDRSSAALATLPQTARRPLLDLLSKVIGYHKPATLEEKAVLSRLPLFHLRGSFELTSVENCPDIAPSPTDLPDHLPLKKKMIRHPKPDEEIVLRWIPQSNFLSFSDIMRRLVFPSFSYYGPEERIKLAKHILIRHPEICERLEVLQFVPVSSGHLKSPVEIFASTDKHGVRLFSGKPMFSTDRDLEKLLHNSPISFRSISSVTTSELVTVAKEAGQGDIKKGKGLLQLIAEHAWMERKLKETTFLSGYRAVNLATALADIPWLPCLTDRPRRYPKSLAWKATSKMSKPSETFYTKPESQDVVCNIAGSQLVFLDFPGILTDELVQLLGFATLTYDTVLEHLRTAMHCWKEGCVPHDEAEFFGEMMCNLLRQLGSSSRNKRSSLFLQLQQWTLQSIDWIWLNSKHGFVKISQLILEDTEWRLEDWRFSVASFPHLDGCVQLFTDLGMKSSWDKSDLMSLLKDVKEFHSTRRPALTKQRVVRDLQLSLSVLNLLTKDKDVLPVSVDEEVFVPVEGPDDKLELALTSTVTYGDAKCLRDVDKEALGEVKLIHRGVPQSTAFALGVRSLVHKLAPPEELDFDVEEFGQHEPLTVRLNNILKEYKDDASIFKELIQNADDAGATEVKFLVDWRQHHCSSLLSPEMAACQGPALLAYNNAVFTPDDFVNISKLAAGTKRKSLDKIGRFGVGFSSVYHLTEVPSFVSGEHVAIFDPHGTHLGKYIRKPDKPGAKINFMKNPVFDRFPDQFMPYIGVFGCNQDNGRPYAGTLFRFPFRTRVQAKASEIKNEPCDKRKVGQLIRELEVIAKKVLIFLNNVRTVKVFELLAYAKSPAEMKLLSVVESKQLKVGRLTDCPSHGDVLQQCQMMVSQSAYSHATFHSNPSLHTSATVIEITRRQQGDKHPQCQHFLVCSSIGTKQAMEIACSPSGKEAGCMPLASVAIQLKRSSGVFVPVKTKGEAFCVLPLSELTGLPFHVSGFFAVLSNRRGLWWYNLEEAVAEHGVRSLDPAWNEALIRDAVATACILAIETLQQMDSKTCCNKDSYYKVWPKSEDTSHPMWKTLVSEFYSLMSNDRPLMCTARTPSTWLPLSRCLFLSELATALPHACSIARQLQDNYVEAPTHVLQGLQSVKASLMKKLTWDQAEFISGVFGDQTHTTALKFRQRNELVIELLQRVVSGSASTALLLVLKSTSFVPSSPDGVLLRSPQDLIDPRQLSGKVFLPKEGRFPWSGLPGLRTNEETVLVALKKLGMRGLKELTWDDCVERAETVHQLVREDVSSGMDRVKALLKLVKTLEDKDKSGLADAKKNRLRQIPFLPVMKRPSGYPLAKWHADSCSAVVGSVKNVFAHELWHVIGSQSLVLASSLSLPVTLHIQHNPNLDAILQQMGLVLGAIDQARKGIPKQLANMIFSIYRILEEKLELASGSIENALEYLGERPWLYVEGRLVKPHQLAFHCSIRAPPYLYEVTADLNKSPLLLKAVGVRSQFSCEDYVLALQAMMRDSSGRRLGKEIEHCAQQILNEFTRTDKSKLSEVRASMEVPVLSRDCCLLPATSLAFNDAPWMSDSPTSGDKLIFVHDSIARPLAIDLGVQPVRHKMLDKYASDIPGEPFGQTENLTQRLSDILKGYPWGEDILKELIQNADDAGATLLHIIYDRRQHGQKSVFCNAWKDMQGPAICVYNNRVFTKKDIEGIQNLGRGSKRNDPSLAGQYGIGFNAMYHLTDCPTFVSNNETLCILDPHCHYVPGATKEKPGRLFDVRKTFWQEFSDIAHCYQSLPDVTLLNGTLFRFPLRTDAAAKMSEIKSEVVMDSEILQLFKRFREEAPDMLLFLNHVCSIKLSTVNPDGSVVERFEVVAAMDSSVAQKRRDLAAAISSSASLSSQTVPFMEASYIMTISTEDRRKPDSTKSFRRWLIYQCIGSPCTDSFAGVSQLSLLPRAGIAAPVDDNLDCSKGRVFCFLPLPEAVRSRLPVHVNGHFALDSTRRYLWEDTSKAKSRRPSERQGWNEDLIKFVLAPAYCHFLVQAKKFVLSQSTEDLFDRRLKQLDMHIHWFNSLFPGFNTPSDGYWGFLSREVYSFIFNQQLTVFPCVGCSLRSDRPALICKQDEKPSIAQSRLEAFDKSGCRGVSSLRWLAVNPPNLLGLHQSYFYERVASQSPGGRVDNYILKSILLRIGVPIVASPFHVLRRMQEADDSMKTKTAEETPLQQGQAHVRAVQAQVQTTTPQVVLLFLRHYHNLEVGCNLRTGYVTSTILRNVDNVKVLLRYVMSEQEFCYAELDGVPLLLTEDLQLREFSSQSPAYVSRYSSLLPRQQELFVHQFMRDSFLSLAPDSKVVREFSPDQLVRYLPCSGIYDAKWEYTDRYIDWQTSTPGNLPTRDWLKTLWRYLGSLEGSCDETVEALKQWPVVPAQHGTLLVPVSLAGSLFCFGSSNYTPDHDSDMEEYLRNLGAAEIDVDLMEETARGPWMKEERTLHSLLNGRVAVLNDHISVLKALDYVYGTFCPPTEIEAADRFLKYFETALSTFRRRKLLSRFRSLPLFETADGRLIACMDCCVMPHDIAIAGSDTWMKQSSRVFLKYKPAFNSLYSALQLNDRTCEEIYTDCILPCFPKLYLAHRLVHLAFIEDHQHRKWSKVVNDLKRTPCFQLCEKLEPVSSFYDPTVHLFHLMLADDYFPPLSPCDNDDDGSRWLRFLRALGLNTVCPSPVFQGFAYQLHKEAHSWMDPTQVDILEWKAKSIEMVCHLSQNIDEYKSSLTTLGQTDFLECGKVSVPFSRLALPFRERNAVSKSNHATSFKSSVRPTTENEQLCWTTAPLLPDYAVPLGDHLHDLGLNSEPDLQSVLAHFKLLTQEVRPSNLSNGGDINTVVEVVSQIFGYLGKRFADSERQTVSSDQRDGADGNELSDVCSVLSDHPCIFLASRQIFVKPQQVVMLVADLEEISPYLFELPKYLQMHGPFLVHLGVANRATPSHYVRILNSIRERHLARSPETASKVKDDCAVKAAVRCLFKSLKASAEMSTNTDSDTDVQQAKAVTEREDLTTPIPITDLYLPDRHMQLLLSSSLVYVDKPEFECYVKYFDSHFLLDLKQCDLPPLEEETVGLLPEAFRPVRFSEIAEERLDPTCTTDDIEDAPLSKIEATYRNLLSSSYFIQAIHSIYTKEYRTGTLPSAVEQGLAKLQSSLSVKCLCEIRTQLQLIDSKGVVVGSGRTMPCFLEKLKDGATLYLSRDAVLAKGQQQRQMIMFQQIAKQLEYLLEIRLPQSFLMILLSSEEPSSIPQALEDLGVEYIRHNTDGQLPLALEVVKPGMSVRSDDMQLIRFAPDGYRFSPNDWAVYELREDHSVYARVMYRVYSDCEMKSADGLSELQTRYVIDIGREEPITVGVMDLYAFEDVGIDLESAEGQGAVVSQSAASTQLENENIDAVHRQLREIRKLPVEERRKAERRLYLQWHLNEACNPLDAEVFAVVKKEIKRLRREEDGIDTEDELFSPWNLTARSYGPCKRMSVGRNPPRRAPTIPDLDKGRMFVAQATVDLKVAETLFEAASSDRQLYAAVCFHCHEAVEKALKGILLCTEGLDDDRQRSHQICLFLNAAESNETLRRHARMVNDDDYLGTRYPDRYWPCRVPADSYDRERAVRSLVGTRGVIREATAVV